jgi:predicted O-linked N-acetylglucosamine transferase (SPINDLY family)
LLAAHDHERFEIFCYSNVANPDATTDELRGHADAWRSITGVSDEDAARQIAADRIDVLVDLTMHMEGGRLPLFASKPAPVQICWLAYPGTTGLHAIDYRVTDPHLDPPGSDQSVYVERPLLLPDTFWCYASRCSANVGPLPADRTGVVTFGCLNNFAKVNGDVLDLWARVLGEVEGSRLVLLAPEGTARDRVRGRLEGAGVDAARIEFVGRRPQLDYMESYQGIDVALDTFPYGGHTTSLDALWMGVPVVTLVGDTVVGRAGVCYATNLGLPELLAHTADDFVRIARELATDRDRLRALRASLRARIEASPLMDAPRFARNLEAAYRGAWREWCAGARKP